MRELKLCVIHAPRDPPARGQVRTGTGTLRSKVTGACLPPGLVEMLVASSLGAPPFRLPQISSSRFPCLLSPHEPALTEDT